MTTRNDPSACGICGRPWDDHSRAGTRVEYVVSGRRGGIAEFRETGGDSKVRRTDAALLAFQLGVDGTSLVGCRFSCLVTPAEYGVTRSDYRLIEENTDLSVAAGS